MEQIIPGVFTFTGLIVGRVYLVEDSNGLTLVDAGLTSAANKILGQLTDAGYRPEDVSRIMITHGHGDHVGGLLKLQAVTGAEVWCSEVEQSVIEAKIAAQIPNLRLFDQNHHFADIGGGLDVVQASGHTPGHVFFWLPATRVIFCGDIIMRMLGHTTQPFSFASVNMDDNRIAINRILDLKPAVVCAGHGPALTQDTMHHLESFASRIGAT